MLTTRYLDGAPNWIDLATPDLDGAQSFYLGLFGWTFRSAGPAAGGYGMFQLDGKNVSGGMTVTPEQGPPAWNLYFRTPDADATVSAAEEAGGSIALKPMDVMDKGRMARVSDRTGASFGVWQPATHQGMDVVNDTGTLCWTELCTSNVAAAKAFYSSVFDWKVEELPFSEGMYTMASPADGGADSGFAGFVPLSVDPAATQSYWLPYFEVADTDAACAMARELRGTVLGEPMDLPGIGRVAQLTDPHGARFAVIKGAS